MSGLLESSSAGFDAKRTRACNRADFDAAYALGKCPMPPPPRKINWMGAVGTHPIVKVIALILWLPLSVLLFAVALPFNLLTWAYCYLLCGGVCGLARRTTQPTWWPLPTSLIRTCVPQSRTPCLWLMSCLPAAVLLLTQVPMDRFTCPQRSRPDRYLQCSRDLARVGRGDGARRVRGVSQAQPLLR